jgi:DNA-binding NarL/FixJ family response regulator
MRIAFYDDDEMTRYVFEEQLRARFKDVDLRVYTSWVQMAINVRTFDPHVVVIDYRFKNGMKANILYDILDDMDIPVLMYTGCPEAVIYKDAKEANDKIPRKLEYFPKCRFNIFERLRTHKELQLT